MNFDALNRYVVLVKHMNFTHAAEELFLTQPAMSMQLQKIEKEVGCKLMLRTPEGLQLTPEGRIFYQRALNLLAEYAVLTREISKNPDSPLRIGYCTAAHSLLLGSAIADHFSLSSSQIELHQDTPNAIRSLFSGGQLDCILFHRASAQPLAAIALIRKVRSCRLLAFFRKDHPLAAQSSVTFHQLAALPWILFQRENDMNYRYSQMLAVMRNGFYLSADVDPVEEGLVALPVLENAEPSELVFITPKDKNDPKSEELYYSIMNHLG